MEDQQNMLQPLLAPSASSPGKLADTFSGLRGAMSAAELTGSSGLSGAITNMMEHVGTASMQSMLAPLASSDTVESALKSMIGAASTQSMLASFSGLRGAMSAAELTGSSGLSGAITNMMEHVGTASMHMQSMLASLASPLDESADMLRPRAALQLPVTVDDYLPVLAELEANRFNTARREMEEAYHDLQRGDITGIVQHAAAALECVARAVTGQPQLKFEKLTRMQYPALMPAAPLDGIIRMVWGYFSEHGRHLREGGEPDVRDARLAFRIACSLIRDLLSRYEGMCN